MSFLIRQLKLKTYVCKEENNEISFCFTSFYSPRILYERGGGSNFVRQYDPPPRENNRSEPNANIYQLKDLGLDNKVDVLFVVDNSGSMGPIQQNIVDNARLFMSEFINQRHIDWKLGVISTDNNEEPFLGFNSPFSSALIDYESPASIEQTIATFQSAINSLGTSGSASEYVFHNVLRNIKKYNDPGTTRPEFVRGSSHLAVIMVTDEREQSGSLSGPYAPLEMLNTVSGYVGSNKKVRFYGALQASDFEGCSTWDEITYEGSRYENIIKESGGFAISACVDDFGVKLADISKDISSLVKAPGIPLRGVPKVHSIRVFYKGEELHPGAVDDCGKWYYDARNRTINFYTFDFVDNFETDHLVINFEYDDGIPRDTDPEDGSRGGCQ